MENGRLIQELKNAWRNSNSATAGFLAGVPAEVLHTKPFNPRFTSFAWEFACLTRTRYCYLDGLRTGKVDFSDREGIPNKDQLAQESNGQFQERLSQTSNDILTEIEKINSSDQVATISWLLQHERVHHGKLMLYLSIAGLPLPESFVKTWGESNFKSAE